MAKTVGVQEQEKLGVSLEVTCREKIGTEPAYILFKIKNAKGRVIQREKIIVPISGIRHAIIIMQNEWKGFYEGMLIRMMEKYQISPENVKTFADRTTVRETYQRELAKKRGEYGLTEDLIIEFRNKKKRLSKEKERVYQRLYKREYRRIQKMRENNPNAEL